MLIENGLPDEVGSMCMLITFFIWTKNDNSQTLSHSISYITSSYQLKKKCFVWFNNIVVYSLVFCIPKNRTRFFPQNIPKIRYSRRFLVLNEINCNFKTSWPSNTNIFCRFGNFFLRLFYLKNIKNYSWCRIIEVTRIRWLPPSKSQSLFASTNEYSLQKRNDKMLTFFYANCRWWWSWCNHAEAFRKALPIPMEKIFLVSQAIRSNDLRNSYEYPVRLNTRSVQLTSFFRIFSTIRRNRKTFYSNEKKPIEYLVSNR